MLIKPLSDQVHYPLTNFQKIFWYVANSNSQENDPLIYTVAYRLHGDIDIFRLQTAVEFASALTSPNVHTYIEKINTQLYGAILKKPEIKSEFLSLKSEKVVIKKIIDDYKETPKVSVLLGPLIAFKIIQININEYLFLFQAHHLLFDGISAISLLKNIAYFYNHENYFKYNKKNLYRKNLNLFIKHQQKLATLAESYDWDWYTKNINQNIGNIFSTHSKKIKTSKELQAIITNSKLCDLKAILKSQKTTLNIFFVFVVALAASRISGKSACIVELPVNIRKYLNPEFYGNYLYPFPVVIEINNQFSFSKNLQNLTEKIRTLKNSFKYVDALYSNKNLKNYYAPENCRILVNQSLRGLPPLLLDGVKSELLFSGANSGTLDIQLDYEENNESMNLFFSYKESKFCSKQMEFFFNKIIELTDIFIENPNLLVKNYSCGAQVIKGDSIEIDENFLQNVLKNNFQQLSTSLAYLDIDKKFSYKQLETLIIHHEISLKKIGIEKTNRPLVTLYMENSFSFIITVLTLLYIKIPLLIIQKQEPIARLHYYLENSSTSFLLSDTFLQEMSNTPLILNDNALNEIFSYKIISNTCHHNLIESNVAYVAYTSGSTGKPKGIKVSYHNLNNALFYFSEKFNFGPQSKYLLSSSPGFDIFFLELLLPLTCGATLLNSMNKAAHLSNLGAFIDEFKPDWIQATPSVWHYLAGKIKKHKNFTIFVGGESLDEQLKTKLLELSSETYNVYGPTETTIWSTCTKLLKHEKAAISSPICNTQLLVLNKNNEAVPAGFSGELFIAGDGVTAGYLQDSLNIDKFISLNILLNKIPHIVNGFKTGDMVYLDANHNIYYLDREDSLIKLNGIRIDLNEINCALSSMEFVQAAQVILNDKRHHLVAFVILKENLSLDEKRLAIFQELKHSLPTYLLPSELIFIENFPLTLTGKIDKKSMLSLCQVNKTNIRHSNCPIIKIIADVLKLENVELSLSFFEQGGTSLQAIDFSVRLLQQLSVYIDLTEILQTPNIETLVTIIEEKIAKDGDEKIDSIIPPRDRFEITVLSCVEACLGKLENPCVFKPITPSKDIFLNVLSMLKKYFFDLSVSEEWATINSIAKLAEKCRVSSRNTITPLVPFRLSSKSNESIVFIHALGGNVWHYFELSRLIDKDINLVGLESVGLVSSIAPLKNIQEMAIYYSKLILESQPTKITLVGWCMGALIADEMAHFLQKACKEVSVVYINPSPEPILQARHTSKKTYADIIKLMRESFFEKNISFASSVSNQSSSERFYSLTSMAKEMKNFYFGSHKKSKNFDFYYKNAYFPRMVKIHYSNLKALAASQKNKFNHTVPKYLFLTKNCFLSLGITDQEIFDYLKKNDRISGHSVLSGDHTRVMHAESGKSIADFINQSIAGQ